jgi:hypothetical protein
MKKLTMLLTLVTLLCLPLFIVYSAGGSIAGKVIDERGAGIPGAKVVLTSKASNQTFSTVTDAQGNYKFDSLTAGLYRVSVSAKGFSETLRDEVAVGENGNVSLDLKLAIAPVEAQVKVSPSKGNQDPIYQQLRQLGKTDQDFAGPYAVVNNLSLKRDAATFTLKSGEIYFVGPVEGKITAAVFLGEGVLTLTPPTETERKSLRIFTGDDGISEQFSRLVMRFSDNTFDEVKASPDVSMKSGGPHSAQAREAYRDNQQVLRKKIQENRELRTLLDLAGAKTPGFFNAFIDGKRFNKLVFTFDPMGVRGSFPEEVSLLSYGESDWGVWTAFHRQQEYQQRSPSSAEDHRLIDILRHEIEATIKGTRLTATDQVTFRSLAAGTRVLPFALFGALRVNRVQDEQGNELSFIQEDKNEDSDFGVILSKPLEAEKTYQLIVQYEGNEALRDSGAGNFILIPRSTWYPANANVLYAEDRAIFDMTFRFPKAYTLVGTGAPSAPEVRDGETTVAKWSSGKIELAVAGFNYGRFKKKEIADKDTNYTVEFYANEEVPDEIKQWKEYAPLLGSLSTSAMADSALADAQNSTRIYNAFFGKLPYTRIAMTQQPAPFFGQAWPTLVYMPYIAFMDTTQRSQLLGLRGASHTFWKYVGPHEIAHQWWGHIIGWDSYHDQWMSEGFAEFSSSLYVQAVRGNEKFLDFWEEQRKRIVESSPSTKDRKPYTVGPVTQGYRLNNGKTGDWIAQNLIYPKGAYILHMIRMMMYDVKTGDLRFQEMMKDLIQTHFNQDISTEDFKLIVEKHMIKGMDVAKNGTMDWFFNEWVYGTEMPSYKFNYQIASDGTLNAKVTQSGVSANFAMPVPLYVDYGKGWVKLGAGTIVGNSSIEIKNAKLPSVPKRAAICAMNDVLALSIDNSKN